jgi:multiple sugar transport system substrate-binding protein
VTINFADPGSTTFTQVWQQLISEKLVAPISGWTDQWFQGIANGTIATLPTGAVDAGRTSSSSAPSGSGKWRSADCRSGPPAPTPAPRTAAARSAIMDKVGNKALAYGFMQVRQRRRRRADPRRQRRVPGHHRPS